MTWLVGQGVDLPVAVENLRNDMPISHVVNATLQRLQQVSEADINADYVQLIGVPDPKYGEEIMAWVRLRNGETASAEGIRTFCQGQIARFKVPRYVKFADTLAAIR